MHLALKFELDKRKRHNTFRNITLTFKGIDVFKFLGTNCLPGAVIVCGVIGMASSA